MIPKVFQSGLNQLNLVRSQKARSALAKPMEQDRLNGISSFALNLTS